MNGGSVATGENSPCLAFSPGPLCSITVIDHPVLHFFLHFADLAGKLNIWHFYNDFLLFARVIFLNLSYWCIFLESSVVTLLLPEKLMVV